MNELENPRKTIWANRIFYIIFIILIVGSVGFTYSRIVIQKDYQIVAEVSCDPQLEKCFHYEGVVCTDGESTCTPEDAYDYKMISKNAANIFVCEQTEAKVGCTEELSCLDGEVNCEYTNCDPETETCSVPQPTDSIEPEILPEIATTTSTTTLE